MKGGKYLVNNSYLKANQKYFGDKYLPDDDWGDNFEGMKEDESLFKLPKFEIPELTKEYKEKYKVESEKLKAEFDSKDDRFLLNVNIPGVPHARDAPRNCVYDIGNGYFSVNHIWMSGSLLLFEKRAFVWGVVSPFEIKPHTLDILKVISPRPSYLIIGTGKDTFFFDDDFFDHFMNMGIVVDVVPTFEACATFNMCNEDGHSVAAAILPLIEPTTNEIADTVI